MPIMNKPLVPVALSAGNAPFKAAVAGLLALATAMGIGRFAFTPILPMMLGDTALTIQQSGWLASANYAGYLIGALSAGLLRIGNETAIRGGLVAISLSTLAMGLPLSLEWWFVFRLVAGIASAWVLISISAWSLGTFARYERPSLNGIVFAGVGIGIALAGLLCIALLQLQASSSAAWIWLGLLSAGTTLLAWRAFPEAEPLPIGDAAPRACRWNAESVILVGAYGTFGFGYIIPATFLPAMAKEAFPDPALFGWTWPVFGIAAALSTLCVPVLRQSFTNMQVWIGGQFLMAVGVALPAWWSGLASLLLAALMVGGTFMVLTLAAMQAAQQAAGRDAKSLMAAMTAAFAAGQVAGPLGAAAGAGSRGGFFYPLLTAALLLAVGAMALALWHRSTRRSPA